MADRSNPGSKHGSKIDELELYGTEQQLTNNVFFAKLAEILQEFADAQIQLSNQVKSNAEAIEMHHQSGGSASSPLSGVKPDKRKLTMIEALRRMNLVSVQTESPPNPNQSKRRRKLRLIDNAEFDSRLNKLKLMDKYTAARALKSLDFAFDLTKKQQISWKALASDKNLEVS